MTNKENIIGLLENDPNQFPNKKYSIIYADPPWAYRDSGCAGAAAAQYNTMKIDELKELPVNPAGGETNLRKYNRLLPCS